MIPVEVSSTISPRIQPTAAHSIITFKPASGTNSAMKNPNAENFRSRYTSVPFPAYRFIPGRAPHPTRDPDGHSYNKQPVQLTAFKPKNWQSCNEYLYGIDLFNYEYWWEAHEALETVWVAAGRHTGRGLFIQGLIQVAAAHLKWLQGYHDTARLMS